MPVPYLVLVSALKIPWFVWVRKIFQAKFGHNLCPNYLKLKTAVIILILKFNFPFPQLPRRNYEGMLVPKYQSNYVGTILLFSILI